jgi:hypothetical protein
LWGDEAAKIIQMLGIAVKMKATKVHLDGDPAWRLLAIQLCNPANPKNPTAQSNGRAHTQPELGAVRTANAAAPSAKPRANARNDPPSYFR